MRSTVRRANLSDKVGVAAKVSKFSSRPRDQVRNPLAGAARLGFRVNQIANVGALRLGSGSQHHYGPSRVGLTTPAGGVEASLDRLPRPHAPSGWPDETRKVT